MEVAANGPTRLLPLRIVAALLLLAQAAAIVQMVAGRHALLARYPALTEKTLATMVAAGLVSTFALVFLAFARQRFGLWFVLSGAALELALETWAGFPPYVLLRIPIAAALLFLAARRAWPELRGLR